MYHFVFIEYQMECGLRSDERSKRLVREERVW